MRVENVGVEMKGLWEIERRGWRSVLDEPGPAERWLGDRYLWVFMGIYGYLWVFTGIYGCLWVYPLNNNPLLSSGDWRRLQHRNQWSCSSTDSICQ